MKAAALLQQLTATPGYGGRIVHVEVLSPRQATFGQLSKPLHAALVSRLEESGRWPLYSHQVEAINLLGEGGHVIVSTPAASGKSLCYNLPVLDCLLKDRTARALYLFPTKALTQDQLKGLAELGRGLPFHWAIFDGDTPPGERASVRRLTQVLLTNPDMLHLGILPNHKAWSGFFRNLRYVVLDEVHVYRGIFGSHVANLLRRLRRICHLYGSRPQFLLCSATIANPKELAKNLTGLSFHGVEENGAPYGGKRFVFWNPPLADRARAVRRSTNAESSDLFAELVKQGVRTIAFVRTRKQAELVHLYARDRLLRDGSDLAHRIGSYRASYLPEDRRKIEKALSAGELMGVVTTNALELGINIGELDATVISGYPGTVSSTWQQAGRSGRRGEESLAILVAQDNPLDQYLMRHPDAFFGKATERALVSPGNPHIIQPHLLCAAYEAPLSPRDGDLFGPGLSTHLMELEARGLLQQRDGRWHLTPSLAYPAEGINLRSTSPEGYLVVDEASGAILETVEEGAALAQLHPGAVYLHFGGTYLITRLDLGARVAHAQRQDLPYYTQAKDLTDIRVLRAWEHKEAGGVAVYLGQVRVSNHVVGYKRKAPFTEEVLGEEYLDLPPRHFDTVALWFDIPQEVLDRASRERLDLAGGLHAAEHAAIGMLPLFAMCDRNDIGGVSTPMHPDTGKPQVFIYDGHRGGVGITEGGYQLIEELWRVTLKTVSECRCSGGCPSCIQSPKCGNNNQPLDKAVAIHLLSALCAKS